MLCYAEGQTGDKGGWKRLRRCGQRQGPDDVRNGRVWQAVRVVRTGQNDKKQQKNYQKLALKWKGRETVRPA